MIGALLALALRAGASSPLDDVDPTILQDMRYATKYNFVGRRIDGYREPVCILHRRAARALRRAQNELRDQGYTLKVYDCYRPQRAVDHFVRWSRERQPEDEARVLSRASTRHGCSTSATSPAAPATAAAAPSTSRSSSCPPKEQPRWSRKEFGLVPCTAPRRRRFPDNSVSMGTSYDCFDTRSHTLTQGRARKNRLLLRRTIDERGFDDYANEWWHFTLRDERYPDRYFDFPVRGVGRRHLGLPESPALTVRSKTKWTPG